MFVIFFYFSPMRKSLLLFFILSFFLYACPTPQNEVEKKIKDNKMNLPNVKAHHQLGIQFDLSELFIIYNYGNITIKSSTKDAISYSTADNSLLFTIEKFTPSEISTLQFSSKTEDQSNIDILHSFYCDAIQNSNGQTLASEKENLVAKTGKNGVLQHIENTNNEINSLHFILATIHFKGNYYVFQFIAGKEIIPYLYDDFLRIITSIR